MGFVSIISICMEFGSIGAVLVSILLCTFLLLDFLAEPNFDHDSQRQLIVLYFILHHYNVINAILLHRVATSVCS